MGEADGGEEILDLNLIIGGSKAEDDFRPFFY
jgi:hypothetical protein